MKNSNLVKRILTCALGIPALFAIIFFLPQYNFIGLSIFIVIIGFLGSFEMSRLIFGKFNPFAIPASFLPILQYIQQLKHISFDITSFYLGIFTIIVLANQIGIDGTQDNFKGSIERSSKGLLLFLYPSFLLTFIIKILGHESTNAYLIALFLLLVFSNDIFAYVFGMLFGRGHGNVFTVSPKKSYAGFIGGHASCIAVCFVYYSIFKNNLPEINVAQRFSLGLIISLTANMGDLLESVLKRSAGVKDSGKIVPGRGGILDSIDSVIASAPFFYIMICGLQL